MHNESGNIALGDGSVQQFTTLGLQQHINEMGDATNRFSIPD
jgi:prepilin-type processing-associated H-X9-DG protein